MKRSLMLSFVFAVGCGTETGTVITVSDALAPDRGTCIADANALSSILSGFFDFTYSDGYRLILRLRNNMEKREDDAFREIGSPSEDANPQANEVSMVGFDTCWFLADGPFGNFGSHDDGTPKAASCDGVPDSQKRFVAASGNLRPGLVNGVSSPIVLRDADLQGLFGSSFDPDNIPIVGTFLNDNNLDGIVSPGELAFSYSAEDPADPARSPNWGNYPSQVNVQVIVRLRALGHVNGGGTVRSGWFNFPIEICPHCLRGKCDILTSTTCTAGGTGFEGQTPTLGTCLPQQLFSDSVCATFSSCP